MADPDPLQKLKENVSATLLLQAMLSHMVMEFITRGLDDAHLIAEAVLDMAIRMHVTVAMEDATIVRLKRAIGEVQHERDQREARRAQG